ncbi:hypothetical protein [Gordonia sp. SCSIO 19800]|uniref:hypothetical protein n=1 Tax=Gordonia sp. SCSIO 19800 TaxID=2826926 RepID=UPI001B824906|nr:hypothetical protein [Gordonia sp. SCSIO 19800]MBR7191913.1 hypothetical protein [Gordonia sp. SCSIO 19800]
MTSAVDTLVRPDRPAMARAYRIVAQQVHPVSTNLAGLKIDDRQTAQTVAALIAIAADWACSLAGDAPASENAAALSAAAARLDMAD